jgi:hypothetical protein
MRIQGNGSQNQAEAYIQRSTEMMKDLNQTILDKKTDMDQKMLRLGVSEMESNLGQQLDIRG